MQNRKIIIIVVVILLFCIVIIKNYTSKDNLDTLNSSNVVSKIDTLNSGNLVDKINSEILGNKDDLISLSITAGQVVSGKFKLSGSIKGAYFFEANILINILDANKNVLKKGYATAVGEWMTSEPVVFEGYVDVTNLPSGPAFIEIHNDNASDLPEHNKSILVPIIIKN